MRLSRLPFLSLLVVALLSGAIRAGGWQNPGVGARAIAMGSAYRGVANDGPGAYYNPAGLAFLTQNTFNLTAELLGPRPSVTPNYKVNGYGFGYLDGQTRYPNDMTYLEGETSLFFRPQKNDKLVLGLAFFQGYDQNFNMNLFNISTDYNENLAMPQDNAHSNFDVITWQPTAAMKFAHDRLGVGVGLQIHRGDVFLNHVRLNDNPYEYPLNARPFDKFPEWVEIDGFGWGVGANVGIQYKFNEKVAIGANFVSSSKIKMNGTSQERIYTPYNEAIIRQYNDPQASPREIEIRKTYEGKVISSKGNFALEMKLPTEFGMGISYRASEKTLVAADLVYTKWSDFEDFNVKITDRQYGLSDYYGAWKALLTDLYIPFRWKNTVKISLGMENIVNERWTLRGGYMFDPSPIPDNTFNELFIDAGTKHHLSFGAGFKLNERVSFDGTLEGVFSGSRNITTLTDVNNDRYWDNFGGEFKNLSFNSTWALNYKF